MISCKGWRRRVLPTLLAVGVLVVITGCVSWDTRSLSPERGLPIDLKNLVIIHHGGRVVQIGDPELESGALVGYVLGTPRTSNYTRQRELHVYVSHSHPLELKPESSISIPIETIRTLEVYDVALKRTINTTIILSSVLTLAGLYVLGGLFVVFTF